MTDPFIAVLINYGIAGVVIYMFYTLISHKLEKLNDSINRLTSEIINLRNDIRRLYLDD